MKDEWVGNINDFEQYATVRALHCATARPLIFCWMLTALTPRTTPATFEYLAQPSQYRHLDSHAFDRLCEIVRSGDRSTLGVERHEVLGDALFVRTVLSSDPNTRLRMLLEIEVATATRRSLVVFDPDIGLNPKSVRKGSSRSSAYVFDDEVGHVFSAGHSIVVYQHFPRMEREA